MKIILFTFFACFFSFQTFAFDKCQQNFSKSEYNDLQKITRKEPKSCFKNAAFNQLINHDDKPEHQGCCSWHGGVCGCASGRAICCDNTFSPSCGCD